MKQSYSYVFSFKVNGKSQQKTIVAGDMYDAGQELRKLYPTATDIKAK